MKRKTNIDQIIADFLKYIPKPERDNYELVLRRCNFDDTADPIFPIMMFLLFLQDNLVDSSDKLSHEVHLLKKQLDSGGTQPESRRFRPWHFAIVTLLILQIVAGGFCIYKATRLEPGRAIYQTQNISGAESAEIRAIRQYWEMKLENAKNERFNTMNWTEILSNDELLRVFVPAAAIFMLLMLLQIVLMILTISKLIYSDDQFKDTTELLRENIRELAYPREAGSLLDPGNAVPSLEADGVKPAPPLADTKNWGEINPEDCSSDKKSQDATE